MSDMARSVEERYRRVSDALAEAARKAGRRPESVRLVVVTKLQPVPVIHAAIEAGACILGENYAEEAVPKMEAIAGLWPEATAASRVEWHMIGHVQRRKAALVVSHFALLHSLDSVRLAERLDRLAGEADRELPLLLEFNVGGEAGKEGWDAADESMWPTLVPDVEAIAALPRLRIRGLMTMPPLVTDPEDARVYFRRLRGLRDFLAARVPGAAWHELSMGTSVDYPVAVEEGATLVRVGEAILGPRPAAEAA
jgi:pyridoxal phosphate enzyme (YggS family)